MTMFREQSRSINLLIFFAICFTFCFNYSRVVNAFHLSFGHRLPLKAVNTPQLNPDSHFIRPVECRNANNHSEAGICMFSIDCMQNKGVPLSVCKHRYFVGTCCRLPDYNNFVGIVYDLRDTETNHVLEAREVSASTPASTSTSTPIATVAAPAVTAQSSLPDHHQLVTQQSYSKLVSVDPLLASEDTHSSKFIEISTKTPVVATKDSVDFVDERYRISSTSLFSNPTSTATTPAISSQQISTSSKVGESARNSEGNSISNDKILIELANSLTQQQQPIRVQSATPSEQKHAYEIVKADLDSEVLGTFNSVHSPPSVMLSNRPPPFKQQIIYASTATPTSHQAHNAESFNIYELISSSLAPTTTTTTTTTPIKVEQSTFGEVNLVSRGSSTVAALAPKTSATNAATSAPPTTSDQEFTLSTSSDYLSSTATSTTATSASSDNINRAQSTAGTPTSSTSYSSPTSSSSLSMSDLVSSTGSQTTTPFTVSLSTALLPNITSRDPYTPTQQPAITTTTALVSPQTPIQTQSQSQQQTKSPPSSQFSPVMIDTVATIGESSLANFSQLYSNQHSSPASATIDQPAAAVAASTIHLRPSLHSTLHAASKIVTGSSSTNNLIPGLSNLQSAILSHIPFKIASGLSNYLQAAMKPTGTRPLISSNTAPSLQYQQQYQQQQHANASRPHPAATPTTTTSTSTTTTTISTSSTNSPVVMMAPSVVSGGVKFPGDNEINIQQISSVPTTPVGDRGGSTVNFPTTAAVVSSSNQQQQQQQTTVYDVVRESQRVCGRPQVQHHQTSFVSPLAEGANKRMARIVGGNQSSFGQWPWMVSLRQWRKGAFLHKCGAALLNENWAITAAHCVEDVKVTDLLLRLGEFDVSNQEEPFPFIERRVKTVKSHPLFNPKTFEYDLALLKFQEPIKYERNIIPVCVPSGNDSYIDRMATVIGWGRLYEDGPLPDVIQHVDVPIITNNECEKMYKNAGYIEEIPDMFICAGISKGGRDSCEGDSGGPLTMVDHDGRSYLVGIISWGIGCALPSQPGVYTRITAFSGWINELAGS